MSKFKITLRFTRFLVNRITYLRIPDEYRKFALAIKEGLDREIKGGKS